MELKARASVNSTNPSAPSGVTTLSRRAPGGTATALRPAANSPEAREQFIDDLCDSLHANSRLTYERKASVSSAVRKFYHDTQARAPSQETAARPAHHNKQREDLQVFVHAVAHLPESVDPRELMELVDMAYPAALRRVARGFDVATVANALAQIPESRRHAVAYTAGRLAEKIPSHEAFYAEAHADVIARLGTMPAAAARVVTEAALPLIAAYTTPYNITRVITAFARRPARCTDAAKLAAILVPEDQDNTNIHLRMQVALMAMRFSPVKLAEMVKAAEPVYLADSRNYAVELNKLALLGAKGNKLVSDVHELILDKVDKLAGYKPLPPPNTALVVREDS